MLLRAHRSIERTGIAGPGQRFCLWVQGCGRHCEGCLAEDTWDPAGGYLTDTDEMVRSIFDTDGIEGITFLGGEPFEQAEALSVIGKVVRGKGLSVVTFTGYTAEELCASDNSGVGDLLSVTDLLIDGAFRKDDQSTDRPWIGSANQRYIFLTERYSADDIREAKNKFEVRICKDGRAVVVGMGRFVGMMECIR